MSRPRYYFEADDGRIWSSPHASDRARGKCSGIPACCVEHFIKVHKKRKRPSLPRAASSWGYVPCPACVVSRRRVEVRSCAERRHRCTCGQWKHRRFEGRGGRV